MEDLEQEKIAGVPFFNRTSENEFAKIDGFLDKLSKQQLKPSDWGVLNIVPEVSFVICYTEDSICLKFYVAEPYFKADYKHSHDPVSEDSCVEMFIAFAEDSNYYNLEFNALGTCLAAYGKGRAGRQRLDEDLINHIRHALTWKSSTDDQEKSSPDDQNKYQWTLTLEIPLSTFSFSNLVSLDNSTARINTYKCGEKLKEPHYLMWNAIETKEPDYHQPDFFKKIFFEGSGI